MTINRIAGWVLALGTALVATSTVAQVYPDRPIRLIVPFAAAGGADLSARAISDALAHQMGQALIVDNRPGAGTSIGTDIVAKAAPDGYTLLLLPGDFAAIDMAYGHSLPYDSKTDFTYIAGVSSTPFVLVASTNSGIKSVQDLVKHAKANPGKLNFASLGTSSPHFMFFERFKRAAGIQVTDIPYKSSTQARLDTMGNQVDLTLTSEGNAASGVKAGKLVAIASSAPSRGGEYLPDLPVFAETFPDVVQDVWFGLAGPAKMPPGVVDRLTTELALALKSPATIQRLGTLGLYPWIRSSKEVSDRLMGDVTRYKEIIQNTGAKAEGR